MSLHQPKARLAGVSKEFRRKWLDLKDDWRDSKCREFEEKYLVELFDGVDNAVSAIEDLDKILKKLRDDCDVETTRS